MSIKVHSITVGPFAMNAYVLIEEGTSKALLIDPGDEMERIAQFIQDQGSEVQLIVATHGHLDHIGAATQAKAMFGVPFWMNRGDDSLRLSLPQQAAMFGLQPAVVPDVDRYIGAGDSIPLGEHQLEILETPGHSPGSLTLVLPDGGLLCGDLVFAGSVGRTDLPGGSHEILLRSIESQIFSRADDAVLYPGHGPLTTVGRERVSNPFLQDLRS